MDITFLGIIGFSMLTVGVILFLISKRKQKNEARRRAEEARVRSMNKPVEIDLDFTRTGAFDKL